MKRLRQQEAKARISAELQKFERGFDARTAIHKEPNHEASEKAWWLHYEDAEAADSQRNIALLRAYKVIGAGRMWATGLLLDNGGRIYMDRSVMRRLLLSGYVNWVDEKNPYFEITQAGAELISEN